MISVSRHLTNKFSKSKTHETFFIPELIQWCKDNDILITAYQQYNSGRFILLNNPIADYDHTDSPRVVTECYGDICSIAFSPSHQFISWYFEFENPDHEMLFKLTWSK